MQIGLLGKNKEKNARVAVCKLEVRRPQLFGKT